VADRDPRSLLERYLDRRGGPDPVERGHRRALLAGLRGRVLELGCGGGTNFDLYPAGVEAVVAVEPDAFAREEAERSAAASGTPVEVVAGSAEALPAADASFDAAVCCWVLCTVPDQAAALGELRRVLRPGGELRVYEHVRSRSAPFLLLQRLVDATWWPRLLGGCRTARDTEAALRAAGFETSGLERVFHSSSLLTLPAAPHLLGTARLR